MSYIDDLRQRVETAEQSFGLIGEQHGKYSERLIGLMDAIEESQRAKQAEIDRLAHENEQVRAMLHAILLAVEEGSRDRLSDAMRLLDARASRLVEPAAAAAVAAPAEPAARNPVADAVADEPDEDIAVGGPVGEIADEVVAAELPADDAVADEPAEDIAVEQVTEDIAADEPVEDIAAEPAVEDIAAAPAAEDAAAGLPVEDVEAAPASSASPPAAPNAVAAIIQRISEKTRDMLDVQPPAEAPKPETPALRSA